MIRHTGWSPAPGRQPGRSCCRVQSCRLVMKCFVYCFFFPPHHEIKHNCQPLPVRQGPGEGGGRDGWCITVRDAFLLGPGRERTLGGQVGREAFADGGRRQRLCSQAIAALTSRNNSQLRLPATSEALLQGGKVSQKVRSRTRDSETTLWNGAVHHKQQAPDERPARKKKNWTKTTGSSGAHPVIAYLTFVRNAHRHVLFKPDCSIIVCNWRLM